MNILSIIALLNQYKLDAETMALFAEFVSQAKKAESPNEFLKGGLKKALNITSVQFAGNIREKR